MANINVELKRHPLNGNEALQKCQAAFWATYDARFLDHNNHFHALRAAIQHFQETNASDEDLAKILNASNLVELAVSKFDVHGFMLLKSNGADPTRQHVRPSRSFGRDAFGSNHALERYLMSKFVDFLSLLNEHPIHIWLSEPTMTFVGTNMSTNSTHFCTIQDLQKHFKLWKPLSSQVWNGPDPTHRHVHVPTTDEPLLQAVVFLIYLSQSLDGPISQFIQTFQPPAIAPGNNLLMYRDPVYQRLAKKQPAEIDMVSIVFPCLAIETIQAWKERRCQAIVPDDRDRFRKYPHLVLTTSRCTTYVERTLDEAYYPSLGILDLGRRNMDQVVSKRYDAKYGKYTQYSDARYDRQVKGVVLLVPQLWIWILGDNVVSAYSLNRSTYGYQKGPNFQHDCKQWIPKPHADNHELDSAEYCVAAMLRDHVIGFGQNSSGYPFADFQFPPTLDMFESHAVSVVADVDRYLLDKKPSEINFHHERRFLHELADIEEELAMIDHVLEQQLKVLTDFDRDLTGANSKATVEAIRTAIDRVLAYQERIKKIGKDSERVEKTVKDMLELRRAYASVRDAHQSLYLSTAVIAFTIVTIIFAPLSFLTALFALKVDSFTSLYVELDGAKSDGLYDHRVMGRILGGGVAVTIAITALAVALATWFMRWREDRDLREQKTAPKRKYYSVRHRPRVVYRRSKRTVKRLFGDFWQTLKTKKGRKATEDTEQQMR